jgi:hypothetical protein
LNVCLAQFGFLGMGRRGERHSQYQSDRDNEAFNACQGVQSRRVMLFRGIVASSYLIKHGEFHSWSFFDFGFLLRLDLFSLGATFFSK